jgi:hypothetical protein
MSKDKMADGNLLGCEEYAKNSKCERCLSTRGGGVEPDTRD